MKFDPNLHHRRSMRLHGYDYTQPGAYFITIATYHHQEIFGSIIDGEMLSSALGKLAREEWFRSAKIRKEIRLHDDEFVVMPNHIHGIVWIVKTDNVPPICTDGINGVNPSGVDENNFISPTDGAHHAPLQRAAKSLSSFIAGYKSAVTGRAKHELNIPVI